LGQSQIASPPGGFFGESVAVVQLPEQQTTGIRGYLATLKIDDDFFGEKAFEG
jgi:hypothetical protein